MKKKRIRQGLAMVLSLFMTINYAGSYPSSFPAVVLADTAALVSATSLNVRSGPGTSYSAVGKLTYGASVSVAGQASDTDGKLWYQIRFSKNGAAATGYVMADYIKFPSTYQSDNSFEEYLNSQGFPESYKQGLRQLHGEFPNWVFIAQHTNLEWNDVINNESVVGRNLVPGSSPSSWKSTAEGAYNWESGTWPSFDSGSWVAASRDVISYYIDPRNFLNEKYVFQFLRHKYNSSIHTIDGIKTMVQGTFLDNSVDVSGSQSSVSSGISPGETADNGSLNSGTGIIGPGMSGINGGPGVSSGGGTGTSGSGSTTSGTSGGTPGGDNVTVGASTASGTGGGTPGGDNVTVGASTASGTGGGTPGGDNVTAGGSTASGTGGGTPGGDNVTVGASTASGTGGGTPGGDSVTAGGSTTGGSGNSGSGTSGSVSLEAPGASGDSTGAPVGSGNSNVSLQAPSASIQKKETVRVGTMIGPGASLGPGVSTDTNTTEQTSSADSSYSAPVASYAEIIMNAASRSGVNPYVLTAMILQEQGTEGSRGVSGKVPGYEGYYNFFNIEAYRSGSMEAIERGLWYASQQGNYERPWNSVDKAILGGAIYYGVNYVDAGQDTFYLKKFNVQGENIYSHQYMTNVQAAAAEGAKLEEAYSSQLKQMTLEFKIPVFKNMPDNPCLLPGDDGSPNNKLSSLSVEGYSLTPTFNRDITSYSLIVSPSVSTITIKAAALDSGALISGIGDVQLQSGNNDITIQIVAQNGTSRYYTIHVVRQENGPIQGSPPGAENSTLPGTVTGSPSGNDFPEVSIITGGPKQENNSTGNQDTGPGGGNVTIVQ